MNIKQKMDWVQHNSTKTNCDECHERIGPTRYGWLFRVESFCCLSCQQDYAARERANGIRLDSTPFQQGNSIGRNGDR